MLNVFEFKDHDGRPLISVFMEKPSKKDYPDYYEIIANPIDMKTINENIKSEKVCFHRLKFEFLHFWNLIFIMYQLWLAHWSVFNLRCIFCLTNFLNKLYFAKILRSNFVKIFESWFCCYSCCWSWLETSLRQSVCPL